MNSTSGTNWSITYKDGKPHGLKIFGRESTLATTPSDIVLASLRKQIELLKKSGKTVKSIVVTPQYAAFLWAAGVIGPYNFLTATERPGIQTTVTLSIDGVMYPCCISSQVRTTRLNVS